MVTLDVRMPNMGGLEALEQIMQENPVPVLMVSSLTSEGGEITLRALELGSVDFIDKSSLPGDYLGAILVVQHMPVGFTSSLAERMNRQCSMEVREAEDRIASLFIKVEIHHIACQI